MCTHKLFEYFTCDFFFWEIFHFYIELQLYFFLFNLFLSSILIYKIWNEQITNKVRICAYINPCNLSCNVPLIISVLSSLFVLIIFTSSMIEYGSKIHEIYTRSEATHFFFNRFSIRNHLCAYRHNQIFTFENQCFFFLVSLLLIHPQDNKFHKLLLIFAQIYFYTYRARECVSIGCFCIYITSEIVTILASNQFVVQNFTF